MHRVDHWHEALVEHTKNREWTELDIEGLAHKIGHSALMSAEGVLEVLEYQQQVDERISAERQHDQVFIQPSFEDGI